MTIRKIGTFALFFCGSFLLVIYFKLSNKPTEKRICSIHAVDDIEYINFKDYTTVKVSATKYYEGDALKNLLQGENYRKSWETVIEAPILFLDTLYGGVTIEKEGGGKQTQSLRLKTVNGMLLSLRSVNKNPKALVPEYLNNLGLESIVTDGISGQHPYASLVVSKLAEAIQLDHTHPQLVFLPNQNKLGTKYNLTYGNRLYFLEYENKGHYNWTTYKNVTQILDTEDLQELKGQLGERLKVDKLQLIKARLFDMVIGDWDRHSKQWGWIITKNDSLYNAIPLPTDRDNAFFDIDGWINNLVLNESITPRVQAFEKDLKHIDGLVYDFDVYFLQNTTNDDFTAQAKYIQKNLTDSKIESAFNVWNDNLYQLDAPKLIAKIKSRRNQLDEIAKRFKTVLDSKPLLNQPLKGSDMDDTKGEAIKCFEC